MNRRTVMVRLAAAVGSLGGGAKVAQAAGAFRGCTEMMLEVTGPVREAVSAVRPAVGAILDTAQEQNRDVFASIHSGESEHLCRTWNASARSIDALLKNLQTDAQRVYGDKPRTWTCYVWMSRTPVLD